MDHPPSPVLVSKFSRSLQARKRKQKSYVVKNKSSNHLNVLEKIVDNNDIITNTVQEIENCLQIVKSSESQFSINDAEILNNNLDNRITSLHEIQSVIKKENDYLDASISLQNNVLNYMQCMKSVQEDNKLETNFSSDASCKRVSQSSGNEKIVGSKSVYKKVKNPNLQNFRVTYNQHSSVFMENDDYRSDEDLLDDGNDSKISNLVNTIMSGTKIYSSTPVCDSLETPSSKLNRAYKTKSININENSLNVASKLFEDIFESPINESTNTPLRKNVSKKPLNFNSNLDDDCFLSDITDTQMNQIVDEAIVDSKTDHFQGFEKISVNNSKEIKESFDENLHQWTQSCSNLSSSSQLEFKGFHHVDTCHQILQNINLEIQRLKTSLPKSNNLKRFSQDENISDKFIKKYKTLNSDNDQTTSRTTPNLGHTPNRGFQTATNKCIEIKKSSKAQNLFNDFDDRELVMKPSKIPLKSNSNMSKKFEEVFKKHKNCLQQIDGSESSFSTSTSESFSNQNIKPLTKLNQADKQKITLKRLAEMEKSFRAAESVFTFHTDIDTNQKHERMSKSVDRIFKSYGGSTKKNTETHGTSNRNIKMGERGYMEKPINLFLDLDNYSETENFQNDSPKNNKLTAKQRITQKTLLEMGKSFKMGENVFSFHEDYNEAFSGLDFQTASNKEVKVNEKSLHKVQNFFHDIDDTSDLSKIEETEFRTASNKTCKINEDALRNVDILFKDVNEISKIEVGNDSKFSNSFTKSIVDNGFSCDVQNAVHVNSVDGGFNFLAPNKTIVNTNDRRPSSENVWYKLPQSHNENYRFQTASCKEIKTNEEAIRKAQSVFKDIENSDLGSICKKSNSFNGNFGLRAISKNNEKSLHASKNKTNDFESNHKQSVSCSNFGFYTASNKKVDSINEKSLQKAENLFKNIDENVNKSNLKQLPELPETSFSKNEDSWNKAQKLFKDIFDEYSEVPENNKCISFVNSNFDVPSKLPKPPVSKNEDSMCKAQNLFKDIFDEYSEVNSSLEVPSNKLEEMPLHCTSINENNEIYNELENAVKCFENMDDTMIKIPTLEENENSQLPENMELKSEDEDDVFHDVIEVERLNEKMMDDKNENAKSEYGDVDDDTLIEDIDNFTDVGSVESKSDLDKEIVPEYHPELNIAQFLKLNTNNLKEPCITLRKPTSGDLKQWCIEIKKQIYDLNTLVLLLDKKKSHIDKMIYLDSTSKDQIISFVPGKLYNEKQKNQTCKISLSSAVNNNLPVCSYKESAVPSNRFTINLWDITPENACELHFYLPSPPNPSVIDLSDNVKLVPSSSYFAGLSEFKATFETIAGVDKKQIMDGWFENHFRWIVWKLASMDRQFSNYFSDYFLTPDNLMQQLKYRYDRDVYGNERSAIRKITEKDDVASRRMVLCVNKIIQNSENNYEIELCDGWYSLKAIFDMCLINLVSRNKIQVGTKLITYGAELINLPDPCHPLQIPTTVRLKLHGNSTRRVKWDTKLGFQKIPGPFLTSLQSIQPSGGYIGRVIGFIARTFPLKYVEKMDNEQWVCRCKRGEIRRDRAFQMEQENLIEKAQQEAFDSLQNEWQAQSVSIIKENKNSSDIQNLTCPKKLSLLLEFSTDPSSVSELLSKTQHQLVADYRSKLNSQRQADIAARVETILKTYGFVKRTVSSILQLIIIDANKPDLNNHYILEIWNPDDFILDVLIENSVLCFLNLMSSNVRGDNTLKATKQTRYLRVNKNNTINYQLCTRHYTSIRQMQLIGYNPALKYCDTVGVIVKICAENNIIKFVWLSDAHFRLLRIVYKMDSKNCLVFEGFNVGDVVAIFNLKLSKCISGQAQAQVDFVTYVTKTPSKSPDITTALENLYNELPTSFNDFISDCDDKIEEWNTEMNSKYY